MTQLAKWNFAAAAAGIKSLISLCLIIGPMAGHSQELSWGRAIGGSEQDFGYGVVADSEGNSIVCGTFRGTVDFDNSAGVFELTSEGSSDGFLVKSDPDGNFLWAVRLGAEFSDFIRGVDVDAEGNIYATGNLDGEIDFDPGAGEYIAGTAFAVSAFILKLDSSGNFIWARTFGGNDFDWGEGVVVGETAVHAFGYFRGSGDFDHGTGTTVLSSNGEDDVYLVKFTLDGDFTWAKAWGGPGLDFHSSVDLDGSGNIYCTGWFRGSVDFDPGAGEQFIDCSTGNSAFITKLNPDGDLLLAMAICGNPFIYSNSIVVDATGSFYTSGDYSGEIDLDPGDDEFLSEGDNYVAKYDMDFNLVWGHTYQMANAGEMKLAIGSNGDLYMAGILSSEVDLDPGEGEVISEVGYFDFFLSRVTSDGNFVEAITTGGPGVDVLNGFALDNANNIFIAGHFQETIDLEPGDDVVDISSSGLHDVFLAKMVASVVVISEMNDQPGLTIYPNPAADRFTVHSASEIIELTLYNFAGQKLLSSTTPTILLENIPSGVMIVKCETASSTHFLRVIKE